MAETAVAGGEAAVPDWNALRALAARRATEIGLPTNADEDWRYVRLAALGGASTSSADSSRPAAPTGANASARAFFDHAISLAPTHPLVEMCDGRIIAARALPVGVQLDDLLAPANPDAARYRQRWAGCLTSADDVTTCWSVADLSGAMRVRVNAAVSAPLLLLASSIVGAHGLRLVIELEAGAALTVILVHAAHGSARSSVGIEVDAGAGARLIVDELQFAPREAGTTNLLFSNAWLHLARDARVTWTTVAEGGALVRSRITAVLSEPGAEVVLHGLAVLAGHRQAHQFTRVEHRVGDTRSQQLYKNLADGSATASFDGLVTIAHGADGAAAEQTNHNLLLSPTARIDTRPQLDIHADDVKASHGATVGRPDPEELFYLRTRGLGADAAMAMLTRGFAAEIVELLATPFARLMSTMDVLADLDTSAKGDGPGIGRPGGPTRE